MSTFVIAMMGHRQGRPNLMCSFEVHTEGLGLSVYLEPVQVLHASPHSQVSNRQNVWTA